MQTILGSGGAIGTELAKFLPEYTDKIRLVSRNPKSINGNEELFKADLQNQSEVDSAVKDSEIVYLTVGLQYNIKIWQSVWPKIMRNVIDACKKNNSKLVFFDNIYMYDPNFIHNMNEDTPKNPSSKKGKVRKEIVDMIFDEVNKGNLTALIARSADFYGPSIKETSVLTQTVIDNLSKGKKAYWMGSADKKHSFTFTPDAGKATAILGNSEKAYNQEWHLPTAEKPPTGKEWIDMFAKELNAKPKYQEISKTMLRIMGIFMPVMREMPEMFYQNDRDYIFNSKKFNDNFNFETTSYQDGVKQIVEKDFKK